MFQSSPSVTHFIFDLERSKNKVKDAKISKNVDIVFGRNSAAKSPIYLKTEVCKFGAGMPAVPSSAVFLLLFFICLLSFYLVSLLFIDLFLTAPL